jgi:predicted flap endonuclease-1-like 5' DNA nuclease
VGWRIDIKSEEEKRQEVEAEMARMARIVEELRSLETHGVNDKIAQKLIDAGVAGLAHLLEMSDEDLCSIEGIGPKTAEKIREAGTTAKAEWDQRDAEEAERLEAERAEAERLEAERLETERLETERLEAEALTGEEASAEAEAEPEAEAEAPAAEAGEGGEPDGQR